MYESLLIATALLSLAAILIGAWRYRDTFHPLVYLGALLGILYAGYPAYLLFEGDLWLFLSEDSLVRIQSIYLAGVAAMLVGIWRGSGSPANLNAARARSTQEIYDNEHLHRLRVAAVVVGLVGVGTFAYTLIAVGGMQAAYGQGYGGGWHDSGYVRETFHLTIPAMLWLVVVYRSQRPNWLGVRSGLKGM